MTIKDAVDVIDRQVVNQLPLEDKIHWLSDLDRNIWNNFIITHDCGYDAPPYFGGYDMDTDIDTELLAKPPYDEVYRWYLEMQIHGVNNEQMRYNAAAEKYNYALEALGDVINRSYPTRKQSQQRWW